MTLQFDPPIQAGRYALAYGNTMRVFNDLARAKIAWWPLVQHRNGYRPTESFILENVEGKWFKLYEIPAGSLTPPWHRRPFPNDSPSFSWNRVKAIPMTKDEYAAWRIQVDRELLGEKPLPEIAAVLGLTI